ncbi:type II secretion system protein N [Salinisphaera sp. SPP-AMP-43]|uniref:type II secretion system protein N n=1 Tax=Salinisphaera sp. SPP-AMP-43 TaxID=3121288 RepID=UPI003C6E68B7
MKWRRFRFAIAGGIAFVIGLVVYLPASLVAHWTTDGTPVQLQGVSGTLLDGQAAYVSLPDGALDNLQWQLAPAALLLGRLSVSVRTDTDLGHLSGNVDRSLFGGNTIRHLHGEATIGWAADLAGYTFVPLSGRIGLDLSQVSFDDQLKVSALDGQVQLTNSRWELLNPPLTLGRFQAQVTHTDDGLAAEIVDSHGPLALTGQVRLVGQRRYDLNVRLRARAGADERLKKILGQLGRPDNEGWYRVREQGRL